MLLAEYYDELKATKAEVDLKGPWRVTWGEKTATMKENEMLKGIKLETEEKVAKMASVWGLKASWAKFPFQLL